MENSESRDQEETMTAEAAPKRGRRGRPRKAGGAPRKAKAAGGKGTGKRYTDEQKREIIDFANSIGRGGLTQAAKKYNVSMLSLSRWMKGSPEGAPRRRGRPPGTGAGRGKGRGPGRRGRPAVVRVEPAINKRAKKAILKGLDRMGNGIELLAKAFSHLT